MVEKVQVVEGKGLSNVKAVADKYGVNAKGAVSYQQIQSDLAAGTKAPSLGGLWTGEESYDWRKYVSEH